MRDHVTLDQASKARLANQAQQTAVRLRDEIEERKSRAASLRLEQEFDGTIRFNPRRLRSSQTDRSPSVNQGSKSRLLLGSRQVANFTLPVAIGRAPRSAHGTRHLTYKIEAIPRALVKRRLRTGTVIGPGSAEDGALYALGERSAYLIGDRNQKDFEGRVHICSNIDDDPEKCVELFATAERTERKPSPDLVTIDMGRCRAQMRRVADHPECEPAVIAAYLEDPDGIARVQLRRGAETLKRILRECDGRPKVRNKREQEARDRDDGIKWKLGRGGRVQWRIMVSFPWYFNAAQREEALQLICDYFGAKECMYMGVIHEASAANHWQNNHCHIDLYDRPCRRLTDDEEHDLANIPDRWITEVRKEYRNGAFKKDIGRWDFEVERDVRYESGNRGTHRIFGANKSKAMRSYSVPNDSRRDIAAIINQISVRDFGRESVHHQTHAEMRIPKDPDEPLGPRDHALQGKGSVSDVGLRNELRHAEFRRQEIELQYRQRVDQLTQCSVDFIMRTDDHRRTGARFNERDAASTALLQERELAQVTRDAAILRLEIHRQLSSAQYVIRTSSRVIRKGEDKHGDHAARRDAARQYWRTWVIDHDEEVRLLKDLKARINGFDERPSLEVLISAALAPQPAGKEAEPDRVEDQEPKRPILPTRRFTSLLEQQGEATPPAEMPALSDTSVTHAGMPVTQEDRAGAPILVVPPLPIVATPIAANELVEKNGALPVASGNAARQSDGVTEPAETGLLVLQPAREAGLDRREDHVPKSPILVTKRMNSLLGQLEEAAPPAEDITNPHALFDSPEHSVPHVPPLPIQGREAPRPLLVVPPLTTVPKPLAVNVLVEKEGASLSSAPASIESEVHRVSPLAENASTQAATQEPLLSRSGAVHTDACPANDRAATSVEARPKIDTLELANQLARGADPAANRPLAPATKTKPPLQTEQAPASAASDAHPDDAHGAQSGHNQSSVKTRLSEIEVSVTPPVDDRNREKRDATDQHARVEQREDGHVVDRAKSAEALVHPNIEIPTARQSQRDLMRAWRELGLNEMDIADEIGRAKCLLVSKDGEVAFATPTAVPDPHRLFLAAFPSVAKHLFIDQQARIQAEVAQALAQGDPGIG